MKTEFTTENYRENAKRQLREWVAGTPVHNPLSACGPHGLGECCPDFSCCFANCMEQDPDERMKIALAACDRIHWLNPEDIVN